MTQRHIISVSLDDIKTNKQLRALFQDEQVHVASGDQYGNHDTFRIPSNKRLYVLEDVDACSDLVLDRAWQKPKTAKTPTYAGPSASLPRPADACVPGYPQTDIQDINPTPPDRPIDLGSLLNMLDGSESSSCTCLLSPNTVTKDIVIVLQTQKTQDA